MINTESSANSAVAHFEQKDTKISAEQIQQTLDSQNVHGEDYRTRNLKLQMLRAQNPFLQILPFPNSTIIINLTPAKQSTDINLPPQTKLVYIAASSEIYISRNGNAMIPGAANANPDNASGSFVPPQGIFLYVEEMNQFTVIAQNDNTRVSIACYIQL